MVKDQAIAILLAVKGLLFLTVALVDWLSAKANASERPCLIPFRVGCEFCAAIEAAWHGQRRQPSLLACTQWSRRACGPSRAESTRPFG